MMIARERPTLVSVVMLLGASAWVACGGGAGGPGAAGSSGCPATAVTPPAGSVPAQGSVAGTGVAGQLCSNGVSAVLESTEGAEMPPNPFVFALQTAADVPGTNDFYVTYDDPPNAYGGDALIIVGLPSASAGTYESSSGTCGKLQVCVLLPVAGATCADDGTCAPDGSPSYCYEGLGPTACDDSRTVQTPEGSWSLTLTSVSPTVVNGVTTLNQTVHGHFSATLVRSAPGQGSATITATF
jgi:hypothetical protein